jgi:nucleoside-diphosphate-sugar epimerase
MKILVFGATGTIGTHAVAELRKHHAAYGHGELEMIQAHRSSTEQRVDALDDASVAALFERVGTVDAVVSAIGTARWDSAADATLQTYTATIEGKLVSQLRIALAARGHLSPHGSITLTSGIVGNFAFPGGSASAVVNQGIDAFVRTATPELPGIRMNAVSATVVEESAAGYGAAFPGFPAISGEAAGRAFVRSVFGVENAQTITAWG